MEKKGASGFRSPASVSCGARAWRRSLPAPSCPAGAATKPDAFEEAHRKALARNPKGVAFALTTRR